MRARVVGERLLQLLVRLELVDDGRLAAEQEADGQRGRSERAKAEDGLTQRGGATVKEDGRSHLRSR